MDGKKVFRGFVMITQVGISMMVPIFICGAIGYWLNGQFHNELLFLLMLVLGIGAAFRNLFMLAKPFYASDMKKEQEKVSYMKDLKEYHAKHPEEEFPDVLEGKKKRYPENAGPTRH